MRKCNSFILMALTLLLTLVSCNKPLTPNSLVIQGDLKSFFQVVNKEYNVSDGSVILEFKRTMDGMPAGWTKDMNIGSNEGEYEMELAVDFYDDSENIVGKSSTELSSSTTELKALVQLSEGEKSSIRFKAPKGATHFKVSSSFTAHVAAKSTPTTTTTAVQAAPVAPRDPNHVNFAGSIAKAGSVYMTLNFSGNSVSGSYYYGTTRSPLSLSGTRNGSHIELYEYNKYGEQSGVFSGTYNGSSFSGTMTSYYSKNYGLDYDSPHYHSFNLVVR